MKPKMADLKIDIFSNFQIQKRYFKTKRVCNPGQNTWNKTTAGAMIPMGNWTYCRTNIYAEKGFAISGKHSRADGFPGTIIYYYEVKKLWKSE
jgi:hypothetical protein